MYDLIGDIHGHADELEEMLRLYRPGIQRLNCTQCFLGSPSVARMVRHAAELWPLYHHEPF